MNTEHTRELLSSIHNLHARFGYPGRAVTKSLLAERVALLKDEVGELGDVVDAEYPMEFITEEAVDLVYASLGTLSLLMGSVLDAAVAQVVAKNAAKTPDTHYYHDGKIRPLPECPDCEDVQLVHPNDQVHHQVKVHGDGGSA